MSARNLFVGSAVADRYARARPGLHGHVADLIGARHPWVRRAVDVACGTGLSTTPFLGIAERVVGVDASEEMLARAPREQRVSYAQAPAERLPFADLAFELATVSSAIHWFERDALAELHRILAVGGALVVYDVWFPAWMPSDPRFAEWMSEVCAPRYRPVVRNRDNLSELEAVGFRRTWDADLRYPVEMDLSSLVELLMTHSERIQAIAEGGETEAEQRAFLTDGLRPLFSGGGVKEVEFGIRLRAFERDPSM